MRAIVMLMCLCACAVAHADEVPPSSESPDAPGAPAPVNPAGFHGSIAGGGGLMLGGVDRWAGSAAIDVIPGGALGHWGVTLAVRDVGYTPFGKHGLATVGVIREAAAARPLLALYLHGDAGVAWGDRTVPALGGGVKTYLGVIGPLGVALDSTVHLEVDGVDGTHLLVTLALMVGVVR